MSHLNPFSLLKEPMGDDAQVEARVEGGREDSSSPELFLTLIAMECA
jgi:hypothetical protein